jgi:hypothetical protein
VNIKGPCSSRPGYIRELMVVSKKMHNHSAVHELRFYSEKKKTPPLYPKQVYCVV